MSPRNGDKSRFNRERKQKITRRKRTRCGQPLHPIKGKVEIPRTATSVCKGSRLSISQSRSRKVLGRVFEVKY